MNYMNPRIKKKWVAALRSGLYKQGMHQLRNNKNEFCCLGVLCNLHAQAHPEFAKQNTCAQIYDNQSAVPSKRVRDWAELKLTARYSVPHASIHWQGKTYGDLIYANDSGVPFSVIADFIEANF